MTRRFHGLMCSPGQEPGTETRPMDHTTNASNAPKPPTAAEAYAARRTEIARLLDVLGMHLDINDAGHADMPGDWGFIGNLDQVRKGLVGLVGFLANMDEADVERFLTEAE